MECLSDKAIRKQLSTCKGPNSTIILYIVLFITVVIVDKKRYSILNHTDVLTKLSLMPDCSVKIMRWFAQNFSQNSWIPLYSHDFLLDQESPRLVEEMLVMTHYSHKLSIFDVGWPHDCLFLYFQIEWFMHQKEKKYKLFSTSLKDPMLSDQWYIVSCSLQILSR